MVFTASGMPARFRLRPEGVTSLLDGLSEPLVRDPVGIHEKAHQGVRQHLREEEVNLEDVFMGITKGITN